MSKSTIIKGTLILTIAGLLTRVIGFFYKIFLSNTLGPELLGVYQLIFPIYGICFTLYASGIQTAISKLVAEEYGKGREENTRKILRTGIFLSLCIASIISVIIYTGSDFIATKYLMEEKSRESLRILAYVFPFCGTTACINGYYYGKKKAMIPASTQLIEQLVRVAFVYFAAMIFGNGKLTVTCELSVWGIVAGEIASNIYNVVSLRFQKDKKKNQKTNDFTKPLLKLSVPLSLNHLLISILHSLEAVMIPAMLRKHGLSAAEALGVFGVLNGMSLPFLLFPSAITNSLSVLLLPTISEAKAKDNDHLISLTVSLSLKYCLILGIFAAGFFIYFGKALGFSIFHIKDAGIYLSILAWLCPFLYVTTTLSSIINGLGKANLTFINSVIGLGLRIICMVITVPRYGIYGYLISLLVSQLLITTLDFIIVYRYIHFSLDATNSVLKPGITIWLTCSLFYRIYLFLAKMTSIPDIFLILCCCIVIGVVYLIVLFSLDAIKMKEWQIK